MRSSSIYLLTLASYASYAAAYQGGHRDIYQYGPHLTRRNIVSSDDQLAQSYDFVIVGGGTAGLVLAARLSEDSNHTVLCLEAGDTGDAVKTSIDIPANTYYQSLLGSSYDWNFNTVKQPNANNRPISWPRGKVLGGSSAINGMYMVRPAKLEVDAWAALIDGGEQWNWDNLFAAMKGSEKFTVPSADVQQAGNLEFNTVSRGSAGPVQVSYPGYIPPIVGNWTATLSNIGIPTSADAYGGEGWGAFVATVNINPQNYTRSYSRSAYIDPLPPRSNLAIVPNATVTRLLFTNSSGNLVATSVEYANSRTDTRKTIKVNKEVILAGGALGSPHVLLHSGVGPADVLSSAGVPITLELPGVGQHLQDHISTQVTFSTTADTAASFHYSDTLPNGVSESTFLSFINSATGYANISDLVGLDSYQSFQANIASAIDSSAASLVPSQDPTVIAGYKAIYNATANMMLTPVGQVEILLSLTETQQNTRVVAVQAALQHPMSQGRLYINSADPFEYPVIDPGYYTHSADHVLLREGLKLARKIGNTAPLSTASLVELSPGSSVQSDDDWDAWIANSFGTEFHPSCSCAMLPLELGGVVDSQLKVYGTDNVRVVDASIFPIQFAAHLQAPVYGLAERAATLIRNQYNGLNTSQTNSSSQQNNTTPDNPTHEQTQSAAVGSWSRPSLSASLLLGVGIAVASWL
ncbi:GMC oxidoreductase [Trametopsis cervina]|nr:GMC oxidoreductase [Trametopsis cervina]